jgi:hypothetical protein
LLHRVFDEYGLIVCGWSADWDIALCDALRACQNHRFTTYWALRGTATESAKELAILRRAKMLTINDANSLFLSIEQKLSALDSLQQPHPLSVPMAIASTKRYLKNAAPRIDLLDLVDTETRSLLAELQSGKFDAGPPPTKDTVTKRAVTYEHLTEVLRAILITGVRFGDETFIPTLVMSFSHVANAITPWSGITSWLKMRRYPALLVLYSTGIAALATDRYDVANALFNCVIRSFNQQDDVAAVTEIYSWNAMDAEVGRLLQNMERRHTPLSDHMVEILKPLLMQELFVYERDHQLWFDRFEFLLAAVFVDIVGKGQGYDWCPIGRFGWKYRYTNGGPIEFFGEDLKRGLNGSILGKGLFGGSLERAKNAIESVSKIVRGLGWH